MTVIESLKFFVRRGNSPPKCWRLVTHQLPTGGLFTVLYAPAGRDSGLRDAQARRYWSALATDTELPFMREMAA